jgi:hypothetical protein
MMTPGNETDRFVSSGTDVKASSPVGARTNTWNSNLAKFMCDQIVRGLMCTAGRGRDHEIDSLASEYLTDQEITLQKMHTHKDCRDLDVSRMRHPEGW